jgi:hypothetical protein
MSVGTIVGLAAFVVLGAIAFCALIADGMDAARDHAEDSERAKDVLVRQLRLSHAMKKRGNHLLAGKHYRPVLTKAEPVTVKPRLAVVRGKR